MRRRAGNLIGFPSGEHEARVGALFAHRLRRGKEKVEPLIRLERAGVEHHRRRRVDAERGAHSGAASRHRRITRPGRIFDEHDSRAGNDLRAVASSGQLTIVTRDRLMAVRSST